MGSSVWVRGCNYKHISSCHWDSVQVLCLDLVFAYVFFPSHTTVPVKAPREYTYLWTKLHKGNIIPGCGLPGILHEEANCTAVPVWSWHILFESAPCEMNRPIINLKASNWECPIKIQDMFNKCGPIPFTAFMLYEYCYVSCKHQIKVQDTVVSKTQAIMEWKIQYPGRD